MELWAGSELVKLGGAEEKAEGAGGVQVHDHGWEGERVWLGDYVEVGFLLHLSV